MQLPDWYFILAPTLITLVIGIAVLRARRRARRPRPGSLTARLDELERLRDAGKISAEEYARARAQQLDSL